MNQASGLPLKPRPAANQKAWTGGRLRNAPRPRTLLDVFNATVVRCGGAVALEAPDRTLTYRELAEAASEVARALAAKGVGPGERVAVRVASGTASLYLAILGVLWAGAAYVPIDAEEPEERVRQLLGEAEPCAVVEEGLRIRELRPARGESREPTPDDDAWIIFTSGSTGKPKGVAVSHRSAAAFVDAEAQLFALTSADRVLAGLSVAFDASCEEIWLAWRHGATLVPAPRALVKAGSELGPFLAAKGITVVSTVPSLAALWEEGDLAAVRLLILGGEVCPEQLGWRLARGREVWNTYGPTEAAVVTTAGRIEPGRPVTIGWPLPGWEVKIIDRDGRPVPLGAEGELVIAGVGLGRYLDPTVDQERFVPLPAANFARAYRSGDIVRETIDGIAFVGRRDDQVKVGGRRLELAELDARCSEAPNVRTAACAVRETAAGNKVVVAYLVGEQIDLEEVRRWLAARLPAGLPLQLAELPELPRSTSGKVDRRRLPWPLEAPAAESLPEDLRWLAERWREQLGPVALTPQSDFFSLGGASLAAAKLATALRERYPALAVADIYHHRTLGALAKRLRELEPLQEGARPAVAARPTRFAAAQLAALFGLVTVTAPAWVLGTLILNRIYPGALGPQVWWLYLFLGWLLLASRPSRLLIVAGLRRLLLPRVREGRYPRHSFLTLRLWLLERLAEAFTLEGLGGTPWAARYARLVGHKVGRGARLGTIPSPASFVEIGEGATLEDDVDVRGWWIEGPELVVGMVKIGKGARIGTRALLMPGAQVGEGAEVEAGALVWGVVGSGERWAGVPAKKVGRAGEGWPAEDPPPPAHRLGWKLAFLAGLLSNGFLSLLAIAPGLALLLLLRPVQPTPGSVVLRALELAPAMSAIFVLCYAVFIALTFRTVGRLIKPGLHHAEGAVGFALWFCESLMARARDILFPLYSSLYTPPWLRLAGIPAGKLSEISTAVGLTPLDRFKDKSLAADDVVFATARARNGWLCVEGSVVGEESFVGNGAILRAGTEIDRRCLVGVLTAPPQRPRAESSWFGTPALELPRPPLPKDRRRTTDPPRRLVVARAAVELVRILLPAVISTVIGALAFWGMDRAGLGLGVWAMFVVAPLLLLAGGVVACLATVALKWLLIGRYRAGEHPLWSFFVWRDEIVNSCQELLAGAWLLDLALGTPIMSLYLRLMGSRVGRDVWCETLTITEFEQAQLGDGCALNRHSVVETHLFHDRVMRIGPARLGTGATLGPSAATLPDTVLGDGCSVAGRSVVMRGEQLPAGSRWHGAPVKAR